VFGAASGEGRARRKFLVVKIHYSVLFQAEQGSSSFLKKRSKKLLLLAARVRFKTVSEVLPLTEKSFLVLFFKKELLPSVHTREFAH